MKSSNLNWLVGILEADGSFGIQKNCPRIKLGMCDYEIIERVANLLDLNIYTEKTPKGKAFYVVNLSGGYAAYWMKRLYHLMGTRRKKQNDKALENFTGKIKTRSRRTMTDDEVRLIRYLHKMGFTYREIEKQTKRDFTTVSRVVRRVWHANVL